MTKLLKQMRDAGWRVAVHNDYQQDGRPHTFWLFTGGSGAIMLAVKGEGETDEEALEEALGYAEMATEEMRKIR